MLFDHDPTLLYAEDELHPSARKIKKSLLIGTYQQTTDKPLCEEHLNELQQLVDILGLEAVRKIASPLKKIDPGMYLGKGKLDELFLMKEELHIEMIIFDDEISPSQQRNLEAFFKCPVIDRTEVILDVFYRHAQTHESKIQVELARVRYQFPRLKRMWTHLSRQSGGGVYLKGEGEKQIELDKRILQRKLEGLEKELKKIKQHRDTKRLARERSAIPTFAIVGYTNAGKSSLLKSLTEVDVFVKDQLFATLDTLTRRFKLSNNQEILMIDTVGFIRKIPHHLVAAFRSTLEEATQADILIHLIDVSHPLAKEQAETSLEVLKELGAEHKQMITVLNKIDKLSNPSEANKFRFLFPKSVLVSCITKEGFEDLDHSMIRELSNLREIISVRIPQESYDLVTQLKAQGQVIFEDYEDNDVILKASVPKQILYQYERYLTT